MSTAADVEVLEVTEAEAMAALLESASPATRDRMGLSVIRAGAAVLGSARRDPSKFWNRGLGFGVSEPITEELLGRVIGEFEDRGVPRCHLRIAPDLLPPDWPAVALRVGLTTPPGDHKLVGDAATVAGAETVTDLTVGPVAERDAETAAQVLAAGFGFDERDMVGLYAPALRSGALLGFAAWDGEVMVAASALGVVGAAGELYGGATLAPWRSRGAQSALIVARAAAAVAAGCDVVVAETGTPGPGSHNSSLQNMLRCGMHVAYDRVALDWQAGGSSGR